MEKREKEEVDFGAKIQMWKNIWVKNSSIWTIFCPWSALNTGMWVYQTDPCDLLSSIFHARSDHCPPPWHQGQDQQHLDHPGSLNCSKHRHVGVSNWSLWPPELHFSCQVGPLPTAMAPGPRTAASGPSRVPGVPWTWACGVPNWSLWPPEQYFTHKVHPPTCTAVQGTIQGTYEPSMA